MDRYRQEWMYQSCHVHNLTDVMECPLTTPSSVVPTTPVAGEHLDVQEQPMAGSGNLEILSQISYNTTFFKIYLTITSKERCANSLFDMFSISGG
jgi:hypothetical protein